MAVNGETTRAVDDSFIEKMAEKLHFKEDKKSHDDDDSSSSSSSDDEQQKPKVTSSESVTGAGSTVKAKISRLFGRERPVYEVLGGGKPADVFMWKNKKVSAGVLGTATVIWVLFELLEYHLLTLVCHTLIFSLAILFLWTNAITVINKSPPAIPEVAIPEQPLLQVVAALRHELNRGFKLLHDVATGKDVKKFLMVVAGLWFLSIVGKSMDFLTLFYINFVLLHTLPVIYEKYEDRIEFFAEKAMIEGKKQYVVVNERYISKIPRGPLKNKKDN